MGEVEGRGEIGQRVRERERERERERDVNRKTEEGRDGGASVRKRDREGGRKRVPTKLYKKITTIHDTITFISILHLLF